MAEKYILNFEANTSKAVKSVDKLDELTWWFRPSIWRIDN